MANLTKRQKDLIEIKLPTSRLALEETSVYSKKGRHYVKETYVLDVDDNFFKFEEIKLNNKASKILDGLVSEGNVTYIRNYFNDNNINYFILKGSYVVSQMDIIDYYMYQGVKMGINSFGFYGKDGFGVNPMLNMDSLSKITDREIDLLNKIYKKSSEEGTFFVIRNDGTIEFDNSLITSNRDLVLSMFEKGYFFVGDSATNGSKEPTTYFYDVQPIVINFFDKSKIPEGKPYVFPQLTTDSKVKTVPKKEKVAPVNKKHTTNKEIKTSFKRREFSGTQKILLYKLSLLQDKKIFITMNYNHKLRKYQIDNSVVDIQYNTLISLVNKKLLVPVTSDDKEVRLFCLTKEGYIFGKSLYDYQPNNKEINKKHLK